MVGATVVGATDTVGAMLVLAGMVLAVVVLAGCAGTNTETVAVLDDGSSPVAFSFTV